MNPKGPYLICIYIYVHPYGYQDKETDRYIYICIFTCIVIYKYKLQESHGVGCVFLGSHPEPVDVTTGHPTPILRFSGTLSSMELLVSCLIGCNSHGAFLRFPEPPINPMLCRSPGVSKSGLLDQQRRAFGPADQPCGSLGHGVLRLQRMVVTHAAKIGP